MSVPDPVELAQALIRCPSVTPKEAGALALLESVLRPLGFVCHRLRFGDDAPVENLYARFGEAAPNFCFAGHTDVVPPGERGLWSSDPFAAEIRNDTLYGRGAADMKSAIAAFVAAAARTVARQTPKGSISLLITGDEEGPAHNGTVKVLDWLGAKEERIDHCLVGEPTATAHAGDTVKIGRRGSMHVTLCATGVQGHTAYPHLAVNPIPALSRLVVALAAHAFDSGTAHFEPTTLAFTGFDVGNAAGNVIPATAKATANIRFNDLHTPETLRRLIETEAAAIARESGTEIAVTAQVSGTAFLTAPGAFTDMLANACAKVTGAWPAFSTGGGTSDARFIKDHCPVAELGLPGTTMHRADESVPVAEIHRLTAIYTAILDAYFGDRA
jgi:succinyl-diaminopimelate desuccinylase